MYLVPVRGGAGTLPRQPYARLSVRSYARCATRLTPIAGMRIAAPRASQRVAPVASSFVAARPPSPALGGDTSTGGRDTGAGCAGAVGVVGVWGAETVAVLQVTVTWA